MNTETALGMRDVEVSTAYARLTNREGIGIDIRERCTQTQPIQMICSPPVGVAMIEAPVNAVLDARSSWIHSERQSVS